MKNWLFPLWVIIDALIALVTVSLWIAAPEYTVLNLSLTTFTLALTGVLIATRIGDVATFVKSHYFKSLFTAVINVILVFSILGVLNYLGNKNYREFDLTKSQKNSLSDQSVKILEMVKSPVKLTLFAKREEWSPMLALLKLYEANSPERIQIEAVDTDLRPDLVKKNEITENGTVLINYEDRSSKFVLMDELSVTNALLKILRDKDFIFYFVSGHDELKCSNKELEGISEFCEKLRQQNYVIKDLDLTKTKKIPTDATAVFILGPASGLFKDEVAQLEAYLKRGGSLFLALAPAFRSEVYKDLIALAEPFGLTLGRDIVIDRLSTIQGTEATIPIIQSYSQEHPITAGFNLRTVFPVSSSVSTLQGNDSAVILAKTSDFPGSWAERDLKAVARGEAKFDEKTDQRGPIGVLGAGEKVGEESQPGSRFILLGSSSSLINAYQAQSGNMNLFLNSVSWLVNDEGIISLNRPGLDEFPTILSERHLQMIFVISIILVPVVFFGAAIFIYRRRRIL